jgi:hypothetical protein
MVTLTPFERERKEREALEAPAEIEAVQRFLEAHP